MPLRKIRAVRLLPAAVDQRDEPAAVRLGVAEDEGDREDLGAELPAKVDEGVFAPREVLLFEGAELGVVVDFNEDRIKVRAGRPEELRERGAGECGEKAFDLLAAKAHDRGTRVRAAPEVQVGGEPGDRRISLQPRGHRNRPA